jgi:hypothetical protein
MAMVENRKIWPIQRGSGQPLGHREQGHQADETAA